MADQPSITGTWKGEALNNPGLREVTMTVEQEESSESFSGTCTLNVQVAGTVDGKAKGTNGSPDFPLNFSGRIRLHYGHRDWGITGTATWKSDDEIVYADDTFNDTITLKRIT